MGKVEMFITDSSSGGYCTIILDSGEKIVISHDKGGFRGGLLTIAAERMKGLASDRIFACDLDSAGGKAALRQLTLAAPQRSVDATPVGAFAKYVKECRSAADVATKCAALMTEAPRGDSPAP